MGDLKVGITLLLKEAHRDTVHLPAVGRKMVAPLDQVHCRWKGT